MQIDGRGNEKEVTVQIGPNEEQLIKINNTGDGRERKLNKTKVVKKIKMFNRGIQDSESDDASPIKDGATIDFDRKDKSIISSTGILSEKNDIN